MSDLGIDTGGTFTDFIRRRGDTWQIRKVLSTPDNPAEAVIHGLQESGRDFDRIIYGSTVATNTLLERKGAVTAFITNRGFEDMIEIGRQNRAKLYNLTYRRPPSLVPRQLRCGLACRISAAGEVLQQPDPAEIAAIADNLQAQQVESVAVCLLFSFLHPEQEQQVRDILADRGLVVSLSHEILPEFREYERAATTLINAYVAPRMARHIQQLHDRLDRGRLRIMQSSGGTITPAAAAAEPVRTVLSGPAGGVVAALEIGRTAGFPRLITLDMGGTSTDVALLDGQLPFTTDSRAGGYPLGLPQIDIHTVGAGGGSLAALDAGGALTVGPESAGADPGPVCYGRGRNITVTDANLLLGRLVSSRFLGGTMTLNTNRAAAHLAGLAKTAGLSATALAEGILEVANAAMERAIRVISVEKGLDPADFTLLAFGGAGGLHAAFIARLLSIPRVLIPTNPGTLSALGMLLADVIKDVSRTVMLGQTPADGEKLAAILAELHDKARAGLQQEQIATDRARFTFYADMRYAGQSYELLIPWPGRLDTPGTDGNFALLDRFHAAHQKRYGYADPHRPVEIVNLRVRAVCPTPKPAFTKLPSATAAFDREALPSQPVVFDGRAVSAPIIQRELLSAGQEFTGPALVCEYSATLVVPPFVRGRVDEWGNIILETG